ncbi:Ig-like domain-containing protein, partial [Chromatium okenii]|uniref:Ig-like domain-containing protein n=1 Tax=Chromatium okenii TaxID=61644 RepID=UPI0026EAAC05
ALNAPAAVATSANYTVDTAAPTLTTSSPADGAPAVAVGDSLTLTFSESVKAGAGNITITGGVAPIVISATDATVGIVDKLVTINPAADLAAGTNYSVQITPGAIEDTAGNDYAGIAAADITTLNFTTAGMKAVEVKTLNTEATAFDAAVGAFSFVVSPGNYDYYIKGFTADDQLDFPVGNEASVNNTNFKDNAVNLTWSSAGNTVTIHLTGLATGLDAQLNFVSDFNLDATFGSETII